MCVYFTGRDLVPVMARTVQPSWTQTSLDELVLELLRPGAHTQSPQRYVEIVKENRKQKTDEAPLSALRSRSTPLTSSWPCRTEIALPREVGRFETNC